MNKRIEYKKGEIIFVAGASDERIFQFVSGEVILSLFDTEKKAVTQLTLQSGEYFGVKSALTHSVRDANAVATSDSVVEIFTYEEFEKKLLSDGQLLVALLKFFSDELRALNIQVEHALGFDIKAQNTENPAFMLQVAKCFLKAKSYPTALDIAQKLEKKPLPPALSKEVAAFILQCKEKAKNVATTQPAKDDTPPINLPTLEHFAKSFNAGQVVICEYEAGSTFYLVKSGRVRLVKVVGDIEKNIEELGAGRFFGEMALLTGKPRLATAVCETNVEVYEFNQESFQELLVGQPSFALSLLRVFCARVSDLRKWVRVLSCKDDDAKVANALIFMCEHFSQKSQSATTIHTILASVSDIASWAGISKEVAGECLDGLARSQSITIYSREIIKDVATRKSETDYIEVSDLPHLNKIASLIYNR